MAEWKIVDGNLPYLEEFPQMHDIDDAPSSLWRIIDGNLPFKLIFPEMHSIDDAPSSLWKIVDGDLPFKSIFPPMYEISKKDRAFVPSYFIFKGESSANFGAVEVLPLCLKHEQKTNFINFVNGSPLVQETSIYKSKVITVSLGLKDTSPEHIDKINAWLIGTGKLIFSDDPDRYYIATCNNALTGSRILRLGKLPVQFDVMPFKYDNKESDNFEAVYLVNATTYKSARIQYAGNVDAETVYKITGTGTIEIHNVQTGNDVEVRNVSEYCIIDIKARKVFNENGNVILDHTYGDIFDLKLIPGNNQFTFSTNVTALAIKRNTRWY